MANMMLEWVFTSIFLILVVLALRAALGKRMSAGLRYALWAVVLARLLVPVQLFTSPIAGTWAAVEQRAEHQITDWPAASAAPVNAPEDSALGLPLKNTASGNVPAPPEVPDAPAAPDAPEPLDLSNPPEWLAGLGWVWLAGSAAVALVFLLSNLRFYWKLRRERLPLEAAGCSPQAYVVTGLPSPCLFGIFRPAVYATPEAAADPDMLRHVLAHECTHYRHGDHIWSLLRCAALAVHWWNPLVWVSAVLSRRDAELACDEGALKRLGDSERAGYGNTLLALVTAKPRPGDLFQCATTMAGDKKSLKERISRIAIAPKRVVWAVVVAVVVTALACLCAFGQAEPGEDKGDFTPTYAINGDRNVLIEGVGGAHVEWSRGTNGGALEFSGDMSYFSPKLEGEQVEGSAYWDDAGNDRFQSVLHVHLNVDDARIEDNIVHGFGIDFTVDLSNGTFTRKLFTSELGDRTIELTDQEMLDMARALAKLLTEAEDYYNGLTAQPKDWDDLSAHFAVDMDGIPEDVLYFVGEEAKASCATLRMYWGDNHISGPVVIDDWRVNALDGPWTGTAWDMDLEVWRFNYEAHTTTPDKAENFIEGDAYLTEDGWLRNMARDSSYAVFLVNNVGKRSLLLMTYSDGVSPDDTDAYFKWLSDLLERKGMTRPLNFPQTDLNRNGVPETLEVFMVDGGSGQHLYVREGGEVIYSEEGYYAHVGYNSLFLCTLDGEDYLLRYHPTMYQGCCTYNYQLFTLENGGETVVKEGEVEFDTNFHPMMHQSFGPEAINAFMEEVNGLLAHSVQLFNTDDYLADTFEKEGRLYDNLWWLDSWESAFVRDGSKSLLENLRAYQEAMEAEWDDPWGLYLTAGNPTPTGLVLNFLQGGGAPTGELIYGSKYWLLREDEGGWVEVPNILDPNVNLAWTDEAYSIPMHNWGSQEVDWSWLYGELPAGHYRIAKDVMDWRAPGDYDTQTYYAQFFVE